MTAKDNGGKTVTLTLSYTTKINDVAQNAVILNICGKLAENL